MNKQTVNLLVFLVILTNHEYLCLDIESYSNVILKNFDFKSPITLIGNVQNISKYTKHFSKNGKYVAFQNYDQTVCGVKLLKSNQIAFKDGKAATLVILKKSTFDLVLNEMVCMLNEEVYLLNENTREIHETYTIKNIRIQRMIARISQDLTFVWTENQSIVKRRSNFHGVHLKSLTGPSGDNVKLDPKYSEEAPYFSSNDTYDITKHVGGIIVDLMSIFQTELNFTTNYFMRKDRQYGTVIKYSNGTYGGVGIVSDLFHGKADILPSPLSMTLSRFPYMDFLPSIDFLTGKLNKLLC